MNKKIKNLIIIFIVLFLSLVSFSNESFAEETLIVQNKEQLGDVNNSGAIDMGDIIQMLRHISASSNDSNKQWILSEQKIRVADINKNSKVDIGDIMSTLRYWAATNNNEIARENPEWLQLEEDNENKQNENKQDDIKVNKIEFEKSYIIITTGKTATLKAEVMPANAKNKNLRWISSDNNIATVSKKGIVKGIKKGNVTITAIAEDGSNIRSTCGVIVRQLVTNITLNKEKIVLTTGKQKGKTTNDTIIATVEPSNATDKGIKWTSSDSNIVKVGQNGTISAVKKGKATIIAEAKDESGKKAICNVEVTQPVTDLTIKREKKLATGKTTLVTEKKMILTIPKEETTERSVTLKAIAKPNNANDKSVEWSSSNSKIATVSKSGVVTGIAKGNVIITATTKDGSDVKATYSIEVKQLVTKVKLNKTKAALLVGKNIQLKATITPKNVSNNKLKWISSKPKVVTVDKNGKVTAKKEGTAIIIAKAEDESKKYATCMVTVKEIAVSKVKLGNTSLTLDEGETKTLHATVEPQNATNTKLTWKSKDKSIATVTNKGVVKGIAEGTTVIEVKSNNNKIATCTVKVDKATYPGDGISLNLDYLYMTTNTTYSDVKNSFITIKGKKYFLNKSLPKGYSIKWSSIDSSIVTIGNGIITSKNKIGKTTVKASLCKNGKIINGMTSEYKVIVVKCYIKLKLVRNMWVVSMKSDDPNGIYAIKECEKSDRNMCSGKGKLTHLVYREKNEKSRTKVKLDVWEEL